jgi:hypothetical protein
MSFITYDQVMEYEMGRAHRTDKEDESIQDFVGKARRKETIRKTKTVGA